MKNMLMLIATLLIFIFGSLISSIYSIINANSIERVIMGMIVCTIFGVGANINFMIILEKGERRYQKKIMQIPRN